MTFGELLREKREAAGLSRRQLSEASGVPFGTVHHYEDGRRAPSFANVVRLANALGLDCTAFSGCEDVTAEKEPDPPAEEPPKRGGEK